MSKRKTKDSKPGPKPQRVIIDGGWKRAIKTALGRGKPEAKRGTASDARHTRPTR